MSINVKKLKGFYLYRHLLFFSILPSILLEYLVYKNTEAQRKYNSVPQCLCVHSFCRAFARKYSKTASELLSHHPNRHIRIIVSRNHRCLYITGILTNSSFYEIKEFRNSNNFISIFICFSLQAPY